MACMLCPWHTCMLCRAASDVSGWLPGKTTKQMCQTGCPSLLPELQNLLQTLCLPQQLQAAAPARCGVGAGDGVAIHRRRAAAVVPARAHTHPHTHTTNVLQHRHTHVSSKLPALLVEPIRVRLQVPAVCSISLTSYAADRLQSRCAACTAQRTLRTWTTYRPLCPPQQ